LLSIDYFPSSSFFLSAYLRAKKVEIILSAIGLVLLCCRDILYLLGCAIVFVALRFIIPPCFCLFGFSLQSAFAVGARVEEESKGCWEEEMTKFSFLCLAG